MSGVRLISDQESSRGGPALNGEQIRKYNADQAQKAANDKGIYPGEGDELLINARMDLGRLVGSSSSVNTQPVKQTVFELFTIATTSIGVVVTVSLIVSGMMLVLGGANEKYTERGRTGVRLSLIGLVLVAASFVIIRIVQQVIEVGG